jgi:hypothetical protein
VTPSTRLTLPCRVIDRITMPRSEALGEHLPPDLGQPQDGVGGGGAGPGSSSDGAQRELAAGGAPRDRQLPSSQSMELLNLQLADADVRCSRGSIGACVWSLRLSASPAMHCFVVGSSAVWSGPPSLPPELT